MESIGNLAGGIAHDFNNILSSIIGFTELALDETSKGTTLEDSLQEVYSAGKRAKDLVKQILAFARQSDEKRSPIQPGMLRRKF
jgi:signal transduction histidine kinase